MSNAESRCDIVWTLPVEFRKTLSIVPLGDVHYNAPMFASSEFRHWCDTYKRKIDNGETVLFVGMGDYLETFSHSERKALQGVHESSQEWIDDRITEDINAMAKQLAFTEGKWIGWITGNHEHILGDGQTITSMLASRLGGVVCGVEAWIRLALTNKGGMTWRGVYDIYAHHGVGGGMLAGSTLNAIERVASWANVDLVMMGHHHALATSQIERVGICGSQDAPRLKARPIRIVRTGSFLKSHEPGRNSYATRKAMRPATLGTPEISVTILANRVGHKKDNKRNYTLSTKVTM